MNGPLAGIRVLDLTRVLAGPWATQLLADYGADVIKIERPGVGDDTRHWGPPWLETADGEETAESAYFLSSNRNKRSVTANLAHAGGRRIVVDLAARADVLIENFRVGTMKRLELDWASLSAVNPRLVYCSISAYGQTGSRARRAGYDAMMQAEGGLMSITGEPGDAAGGPQKVGVAIADIMTGMYAVSAVLAAIEARHGSGEGQYVDVPLYGSQVAWLANQGMNYLISGRAPQRMGTAHPNIVPYQAFATADGHLMLAVGNDRQFAACMASIGLHGLADDPRYARNEARVRNRHALIELMAGRLRERPLAHWLELFAAAGIPAGPINDLGAVFDSDYARETGLVRQLPHHLAGTVPTVANPVTFSATPVQYRRAPPLLGEHTQEVLSHELRYSAERIAALRDDGAI